MKGVTPEEAREWKREATHQRHDTLADQRIRALVDELSKERELRKAFEGVAADLAQSGLAERNALRKVVAILSRKGGDAEARPERTPLEPNPRKEPA